MDHTDESVSIPNGDIDRHGWRQSSVRIDFAPPICALPHSTTDAGGSILGFSGAFHTITGESLEG
jgi:hypothetical protein